MGYSIDDRRYWQAKKAEAQEAAEIAEATREQSRIRCLRIQANNNDASASAQAKAQDARQELQRIKAERDAKERDEWTREVTIERRAQWNAAVRSPEYRSRSGQVLQGKIEGDLGFAMATLKKYIEIHNL